MFFVTFNSGSWHKNWKMSPRNEFSQECPWWNKLCSPIFWINVPWGYFGLNLLLMGAKALPNGGETFEHIPWYTSLLVFPSWLPVQGKEASDTFPSIQQNLSGGTRSLHLANQTKSCLADSHIPSGLSFDSGCSYWPQVFPSDCPPESALVQQGQTQPWSIFKGR